MKSIDADAMNHPAYRGAVARAVERARAAATGASFTIYYDGAAVYVRASEAAPPTRAKRVCVVQRWDSDTVQLRFDGARSEFVRS